MPLIECPMCSKEISPNAVFCPNCGEPMKNSTTLKEQEQIEKVEFCNLILKDSGKQKIKVIKIIREVTGLGLAKAKDLVDNVPSIVVENIGYDTAEEIKQAFDDIGAFVQIISVDNKTIIENNRVNINPIKNNPTISSSVKKNTDTELKCPKCGSGQLAANKKGFGLGKAVGGAVLFGGIGLLGGFLGSGKVKVTCLKCGYEWKAGKR